MSYPKLTDLIAEAKKGLPTSQDDGVEGAAHNASMKLVEIEGKRKFYTLRGKWSGWIILWITVLILFNCTLTFLVGCGYLNFLEYEWFVMTITIETFLQVVLLGYVAVKHLFTN